MINNIIIKIPFIIPLLATIDLMMIKIAGLNASFPFKEQLVKLRRMQFINTRMPFYFNYWILYFFVAIIISIILLLLKKYSFYEMGIAIALNFITGIMVIILIINIM